MLLTCSPFMDIACLRNVACLQPLCAAPRTAPPGVPRCLQHSSENSLHFSLHDHDSELQRRCMQVLLNHILPTAEDAATLVSTAPSSIPTLLGTELTTSVVGSDLIVSSGLIKATVIVTDVMTCAGIVHVVDKVLVPVVDDAPAPGPVAPGPIAPGPRPDRPDRPDIAPMPAMPPMPEPYGDVDGAYGFV